MSQYSSSLLRQRLREFTDREEDIQTFLTMLETAQPGELQVLTIIGNSGTGKSFLCDYLGGLCKQRSWWTQTLSFAEKEKVPEFFSIITLLEELLRPCVELEYWQQYQDERTKADHNFYQRQVNVKNVIIAEGHATVTGAQQSIHGDTIEDMHTRRREQRAAITAILLHLAQHCKQPLCLFIDSYERFESSKTQSLENPIELGLEGWFWEDMMLPLAKALHQPFLVVTNGWQGPDNTYINQLTTARQLGDFQHEWVQRYLVKKELLPDGPLSPEQVQIVQAFYDLTQGHPLVLSLAATDFQALTPDKRTAAELRAGRQLLNAKARVEFIQKRLLKNLDEPYRTLLEYGPILRYFDQESLRVLLKEEQCPISPEMLDESTYQRFLMYPFIIHSPTGQTRFHELVREVQIEALPAKKREALNQLAADYYYQIMDDIAEEAETQMERQMSSVQEYGWPEIPEKMYRCFLEWTYHAFQVKESQRETLTIWAEATELVVYMHRNQSKTFLEVIRQQSSTSRQAQAVLEVGRQLNKEGVEFFHSDGLPYGQYLILNALFLQREGHLEGATTELQRAIDIFGRLHEPEAQAIAYNNLGMVYRTLGLVQDATESLTRSLEISRNEKFDQGMALSLNNLGLVSLDDPNNAVSQTQAIGYLLESYRVFVRQDDPYGLALTMGNMGLFYHRRGATFQHRGDLYHALNYYRSALSQFEHIGDPAQVALFMQNLGRAYHDLGQIFQLQDSTDAALSYEKFDLALSYYERALPLQEKFGNPETVVTLLLNMGEVYALLKRGQEALEHYLKALRIAEVDANLRLFEIRLLDALTGACVQLKRIDEALTYAQRLLKLAQEMNQATFLGSAWLLLGVIYTEQRQLEEAIEGFEQALKFFADIHDHEQTADGHIFLGDCHTELHRWRSALQHYEQAYTYYESSNNQRKLAPLAGKIGDVHYELRHWEQAYRYYEQAHTLLLQQHEQLEAARMLNNLGKVHRERSRWPNAYNCHERALDMFRQKNVPEHEAATFQALGELFYRQGLYEMATNFFEQALALYNQLDHYRGIISSLHKIGTLYEIRGNFKRAYTCYDQALTLSQQKQENQERQDADIAIAHNNIGGWHVTCREFDRALYYLERSLDMRSKKVPLHATAISHNNIGEVHRYRGERQQAWHHYQQAIGIWKQEENLAMVAQVMNNIAGLYEMAGNLEQACTYLERALAYLKEVDAPLVMATVLNNLGSIYEQQGKFEPALEQYALALQLFEYKAPPADRATVLHNISTLHYKQGNYAQAIPLCQQALALYESLESSFTSSMMDELQMLVACYKAVGEQQKAQDFQERLSALQSRKSVKAGAG